jgi:predicted RNase H-like HicB family nuclease
MKLAVIVQPGTDGSYSAVAPSLPGVLVQGDSLDAILANAREAILLAVDIRIDEGIPGPVDTLETIARAAERCLEARAAADLPLTIQICEVEVEVEL